VRRPNVDGAHKSDCKYVGGGPVDEVEVKVVLQLGSIKHLVGYFANPPEFHFTLVDLHTGVTVKVEQTARRTVFLVGESLINFSRSLGIELQNL